MKLYLFDKWEGAQSFSRDSRGLVHTNYEDDSLPETMASDSPVGTLCVWEGTIYDPRKLTDDELDELGISPEAARECDEWWQGKMRPATDAEILAVLSFAPTTDTPAPSVATTDAKVVAGALFDFAGFLTTRENVIAVGASADAAPMVPLLEEWARLRALSLDGADVEHWQEHTTATPDAAEMQTTICGGSGHLSDAAKAELDDFATYLRLKARFDKQRISLAATTPGEG